MIGRLLLLLFGSLAFWVLVALPARALGGGNLAVAYSGTALLLCVGPMALTLAWTHWALQGTPEQQLIAVLGGTGVRIFLVLAGGMALYLGVPYYRETAFLIWLLVCYLATLALDLTLLLAGRTEPAGTTGGTPVPPATLPQRPRTPANRVES